MGEAAPKNNMKNLNISNFSTCFYVRRLTENDIPEIFTVMQGNPLFYEFCGKTCTEEDILNDMKALPPQKTMEDKYYVGFFEKSDENYTSAKNNMTEIHEKKPVLVAVLDLIDGYPDEKTAFIGFFMMNKMFQGKNIGSGIISQLCNYLKAKDFEKIRLGIDKSNPQSNAFWQKSGFVPVKEVETENGTIVVAEKFQ